LKIPIKKKTLGNGMLVIIVESHDVPLVSLQVWYRVGVRNEHEGITGVSHLLEHMMFKGTKKIGPEEFSRIIQKYGGTDNAFTAEDETAYWSVLPSSKLEVAMQLEADRMQNVVFRQFESEKNVVMEERRFRTDNSPWDLLFERVKATAFVTHPYQYPVIGWMSDLEKITLEDVRNHYETYYSPQNAILVISGDVDPESAFLLAEKYFGKIPNKKMPEQVRVEEPPQLEERRVKVRKEGFVTYFLVAYHIPQLSHEDFPSVSLLAVILGRGKSSRLYRTLVQEKGIANDIWVWASEGIDPSLLFVSASIQKGRTVQEFEASFDSIIEEIKEKGVTKDELEKARRMTMSNFIYRLQSVIGRGMMVGNYTVLTGDPNFVNKIIPRLNKVTLEDIKRVANKYIRMENRTIGIFEPIPPQAVKAKMREGR